MAYRLDHSTETALLKIKADILENMDNQQVTGILLLDLSAAFDTVSKDIFINHLHHQFGITGTALAWINDYLSNRTQKVKIGDAESLPAVLTKGVPQGSVLGPILYTLFTAPGGDLSKKHNIAYHGYTDDTQNYHSFSPNLPGDEDRCITMLGKLCKRYKGMDEDK